MCLSPSAHLPKKLERRSPQTNPSGTHKRFPLLRAKPQQRMRIWSKITTLCCKRSKIGSHQSLTCLMTVLNTASCHSHQAFRKSVRRRSLPRRANSTCRFSRITVSTQRRILKLTSYSMKFHRSASANNSSQRHQSPRYSVKPQMQLNRDRKTILGSSGKAS